MRPILIIFLFVIPLLSFSQQKSSKWLIKKFKDADTILLVSHELVEGSTNVQVDKYGKIIPFPKLLIKNRLNQKIVREQIVLNSNLIDSLLKILTRPYPDSVIQQGCILMHHANPSGAGL